MTGVHETPLRGTGLAALRYVRAASPKGEVAFEAMARTLWPRSNGGMRPHLARAAVERLRRRGLVRVYWPKPGDARVFVTLKGLRALRAASRRKALHKPKRLIKS